MKRSRKKGTDLVFIFAALWKEGTANLENCIPHF